MTRNEKIRKLDEDDRPTVPYFGWWWRDVDWRAKGVYLSDGGVNGQPSWYGMTAEAQFLRQPWTDPGVRFDEAQKWDYPRSLVEGQTWKDLKVLVDHLLKHPTKENHAGLVAFMNGLRVTT